MKENKIKINYEDFIKKNNLPPAGEKIVVAIPNEIIKALEKSGIKVDNPDRNYKNFLFNFIEYISNAVVVLCNASTLTLSLSFLYHEEIYFPSKKNNYLQKVLIDEAHNSFPATLNWK